MDVGFRSFFVSYVAPFFFSLLVTDVCWENSAPHQNIWPTLEADCKCSVCCVVALWERDWRKGTCCLWTTESWAWRWNVKHVAQPFLRIFPHEWHTCWITFSAVAHWLPNIVFKRLNRAKWHVLRTTVLSTSRGLIWFIFRSLIRNWRVSVRCKLKMNRCFGGTSVFFSCIVGSANIFDGGSIFTQSNTFVMRELFIPVTRMCESIDPKSFLKAFRSLLNG